MTRVVGVDPGKHIGMSLFVDGTFRRGFEAHGMIELHRTLRRFKPDQIVAEDFIGGGPHVNHRDPLIALGGVLMWAETNEVPVVLQSPAILRARMKQADGLHDSRHVRSSAAHVLHYLARQRAV